MSSGRTRVLRLEELGEGERERWRELRAATDAPRSPFMEPEFATAVSRVRPQARVAVLYEGSSAEPAGFLPYERGALGQGRAIGLGVSDCQGAVLRPGLAPETGELLRTCSVSSFAFDNLEADQTLFVPHAAEEHATYVIDVEKGYETYESVLRAQSPKFLKTTLAKERRLGRQAAGPVRFVFDEREPAALRALVEWKSAQYRRTGRRDRFAQEWITRLVGRLAETRAPECTGTLSVLYAGDRPVAAHFGLRSASVLACWFPAYDPEFAKYSPGLVLHLRMAEAAAGEGIGLLDMGRGPAEYKDSLKTGELAVYEGEAVRPGLGAALHLLRREPVRRAHGFVRAHPRLASLASRALRGAGRLRRS